MKKLQSYEPLDIVALILNSIALVPNLIIFLPLLCEQIKTGWGFPTHFEMMVLVFWLCQLFTIPFIILTLSYTLFCLFKRKFTTLFALNSSLLSLTLINLVFSIVFEFN